MLFTHCSFLLVVGPVSRKSGGGNRVCILCEVFEDDHKC